MLQAKCRDIPCNPFRVLKPREGNIVSIVTDLGIDASNLAPKLNMREA